MPSGGGAGVGPAMKVMQLTFKESVTIDRLIRQNKVSATAKDVVGVDTNQPYNSVFCEFIM